MSYEPGLSRHIYREKTSNVSVINNDIDTESGDTDLKAAGLDRIMDELKTIHK